MSKEARVTSIGYHHISNRGVGLRQVFIDEKDKLFFISLLCTYSKKYAFYLHGYSLISTGYNLIIELTKKNMSIIMKIINHQYTLYYNRKYLFRGYLWEGRYKSWYLHNIGFVLDILSYIEYLPTYVEESIDRENYYYTSYRQFIGLDERLPCLTHSVIFKHFNTVKEIKKFFHKPIDFERINSIHKFAKQYKAEGTKRPKKIKKTLPDDYFLQGESLAKRDEKIYKAYHQGHSQASIGMHLGISQQAIYKVIKKISTKDTI